MLLSLSDAMASDLRDHLLATLPVGLDLTSSTVRLRVSTADLPGTRAVIVCGEAVMQPGMAGTGTVSVEITLATPVDTVTPADHLTAAGLLAGWWRGLRAAKRRATLATRVYLHDLIAADQAPSAISEDTREQTTAFKGDAIVTLLSE